MSRRRRWRRRVVVAGMVCLVGGVITERVLDRVYPYPVHKLDRYDTSERVTDRGGRLLRLSLTDREERRIAIRLDEVSPHLIEAVIAGEDGRFWSHSGVDPLSALRAIVTSLHRGRVISGASTLTMQVARMADPHPRTFSWKCVEMFRARQIERLLSKKEILEHYLNMVPLGGTLRGVEAASWRWFGKSARDLTSPEAAMFVAMLPAPSRRSPLTGAEELRYWRDQILGRMQDKGYLSIEDMKRYQEEPLSASFHQWAFRAPHAVEAGLTSISLPVQNLVESRVKAWGPPPVDGLAVVVVERHSGEVVALLGSTDYEEKPFNAATARRAAASTLKPFLYAQAITAGVVEMDGRVSDHAATFGDYRPENFSHDFLGHMRADEALATSRNLPAIRLLQVVGIPDFLKRLQTLGFEVPPQMTEGDVGLDLALGTLSVSPLQLARAYHLFADTTTEDTLESAACRSVIEALSRHSPDPRRWAAGHVAWKTGTSTGRRDAWCVGLVPDYIVVVWLGRLDGQGDPELVGSRHARELMATLAAALDGNR